MRLLTGNDLLSGAVTWWTGSDWPIHVEDAEGFTSLNCCRGQCRAARTCRGCRASGLGVHDAESKACTAPTSLMT